jgi:hypothetical protein
MDSDDDLRAAIQAGAAFAIVRVATVAHEKAGTRGQVAAYVCDLVHAIENPWPVIVNLKHFGLPMLEADRPYLVGAINNRRHNHAWEVRFAALAEGQPEDVVTAFLGRRAGLMPPAS